MPTYVTEQEINVFHFTRTEFLSMASKKGYENDNDNNNSNSQYPYNGQYTY